MTLPWRLAFAACGLLGRIPRWLLLTPGSTEARRFERGALGNFVRRCRIDLRISGTPAGPGTLFVANHISWLDIAVLGGRLDAAFVARGDLAAWPGIGWLARRRRTHFVDRTQRMATASGADEIAAALARTEDVILFAEGTTSDGAGVLPFRPALFAAAAVARQVQPVALAYLDADGFPLTPDRARRIAWIGDDGMTHVLRTIDGAPLIAAITFLPPVDPQDFACRKALAAACHTTVSEAYAALRKRSK